MTEKSVHKNFKLLARATLLEKGFKPEEIFEEYTVSIKKPNNKHNVYRVDICGISDSNTVAIECGNTKVNKLKNLSLLFDEVIHIPYAFALEMENSELKNSLVEQLNEYRKLYEKSDKKSRDLERTIIGRDEAIERKNLLIKIYSVLNEVGERLRNSRIHYINYFHSYDKIDPDVKYICDYFYDKYVSETEL